jgi:polyhydroxybutyrate depolymerase
MRIRGPVVAVSVVASVVVGLAACSSRSKTASAPTSASSSTTASTALNATPAARVAAQPSAGCSATPAIAPGEVRVNTTSSGVARWYYRHVPPSYSGSKPMPVVFDLHGYSEGATIHLHMSELGAFGDSHGFVTITPEGSGTKVPLWNTDLKSTDVKFIGDLLDEVERTLCVDQRRVFVTGLSNGAFMTSAVACAYSTRFAAAAPVAGIRDIAGCTFARPVPVIAFHGTADPFVSYTGGLGAKALALPAPDGSGKTLAQSGLSKNATKSPTIPQITADWAKRNGCGTTPSQRAVTSDVTLIAFLCPAGAEVELERVTGGGHSWPGSVFSEGIAGVVGKTTMTISADAVMWQFFVAHPLRG